MYIYLSSFCTASYLGLHHYCSKVSLKLETCFNQMKEHNRTNDMIIVRQSHLILGYF